MIVRKPGTCNGTASSQKIRREWGERVGLFDANSDISIMDSDEKKVVRPMALRHTIRGTRIYS